MSIGLGAEWRQAGIAPMLPQRDVISVDELAAHFDVAAQTIRRDCRKSHFVLDASKLDRATHVRGGRIDQVSAVVCKMEPPDGIRRMLDQAGVQLFNCSGLPQR